jgi:hypothetical protein
MEEMGRALLASREPDKLLYFPLVSPWHEPVKHIYYFVMAVNKARKIYSFG